MSSTPTGIRREHSLIMVPPWRSPRVRRRFKRASPGEGGRVCIICTSDALLYVGLQKDKYALFE